MNEENKQQKYSDEHPVAFAILKAIGDFAWFYFKFTACILIYGTLMQMS